MLSVLAQDLQPASQGHVTAIQVQALLHVQDILGDLEPRDHFGFCDGKNLIRKVRVEDNSGFDALEGFSHCKQAVMKASISCLCYKGVESCAESGKLRRGVHDEPNWVEALLSSTQVFAVSLRGKIVTNVT